MRREAEAGEVLFELPKFQELQMFQSEESLEKNKRINKFIKSGETKSFSTADNTHSVSPFVSPLC